MYIPTGFNTITPYFFVNNAEQFVEFLTEGLGGTEALRTLRPDGRIKNVQVRIGTMPNTLRRSACCSGWSRIWSVAGHDKPSATRLVAAHALVRVACVTRWPGIHAVTAATQPSSASRCAR